MDFNSQDSQEIMKNFKSIVGSRLEKLYNEKGSDGELYAYSIAVSNQKKKKAKEETMEDTRLREMVIDALSEKKKQLHFLDCEQVMVNVTRAEVILESNRS
jgi:osmotically-inducible protein OsmY